MTQEGFKRKLTAILSADVIGYSHLMRDDEEATVRDLAAHRVLITGLIQQHHGRVIDFPGDNILADFASVVDAVNGAIKIQEAITTQNTDVSEKRRMDFRIGINLGDVIEIDDRIYGDGVNIAARVEGLATAGGICISGTVYEHVKDKLPLEYEYLGERTVKNIPEPIRLYRIASKFSDVSPEDVVFSYAVQEGIPHDGILDFAKDVEADLVMMTTHGHSGLEKMLIGSTTEKVVRKADIPVFTINAHLFETII